MSTISKRVASPPLRKFSVLSGRLQRREFLQLGALGQFGLSLPAFLHAGVTNQASNRPNFGRAKRCLLIFLNGGPSQIDMWDMKPEAPADVRGELKPIATNVPGIQISELLPNTAQHIDKFKIVRSVTHPCSVHTTGVYTMLTGNVHNTPKVDQTQASPKDHPHLGSIVSKHQGWRDGLPPFVTLPTLFRAPPVTGIWAGQNAGFLGRKHDSFIVHGDKETARFSVPSINLPEHSRYNRLNDRKSLLSQLDQQFQQRFDSQDFDSWDDSSQLAYDLLQSKGVKDAIDLNREPESIRDRYGKHLFGQGLLMARRLIEINIPLITVYWIDPTPAGAGGGEYDSHGRIYHHLRERLAAPTDRALAALIQDLSERGLLEETLVVVMGEFGRSPKINRDAGRDHWPQVQSILLSGAGVSGGTVYGSSDKFAAQVSSNPVTPPDLTQSILHLLGVPSRMLLHDRDGREVLACSGNYLEGLMA